MGLTHKLLSVFLFAMFCQVMVAILAPSPRVYGTEQLHPLVDAAGLIGAAFAVFAMGGAVPLIVWALQRFASETTNGVMAWWAILIAGWSYLQYYGLAHH